MDLLLALRDRPIDAIARFLRAWYGAPEAPAMVELPRELPVPLGQLYAVLAAYPQAIVQNRVVSASELLVEDDKLVFYVENQGVCEWATAAEMADEGSVWIRGSTLGGDLVDWAREEVALSAFVLQLLVFEAVVGAEHSASGAWLDRDVLEQVLGPLELIPYGAWRGPSYPTRFYAGEHLLAVASPNPGRSESEVTATGASVTIAGLDTDALAYLDGLKDEWEWFSRRDGGTTQR